MYISPAMEQVAYVTCDNCDRTVLRDPARLPFGCQSRLRCRACGHRGATLRLVWKKPECDRSNVVELASRLGATAPERARGSNAAAVASEGANTPVQDPRPTARIVPWRPR